MISDKILNRKGARSPKDVPPEIIKLLSHGKIESVNLMEAISLNMENLYNQLNLHKLNWFEIESLGWLAKMKWVSQKIYDQSELKYFDHLIQHKSDSVRCWGALLMMYHKNLSIEEKLTKIFPLADDHHFGVREMAWTALRNNIITHLDASLNLLSTWTQHSSSNIRRFAIEATRPRGVWCAHIPTLKENPEQAIHLLEPLKNDPAKYVQDSVANWLNDACKSKPDWVKKICTTWLEISNTPSTQYICRRALRTLKNKT